MLRFASPPTDTERAALTLLFYQRLAERDPECADDARIGHRLVLSGDPARQRVLREWLPEAYYQHTIVDLWNTRCP